MADDLRKILSRAGGELLAEWGRRNGVELNAPDDQSKRPGWVAALLPSLHLEHQNARARLAMEAEDIADLGQASHQFLFAELNRDGDLPADVPIEGHAPESIALWLWLHEREAFEKAVRRTRLLSQINRPRLCSRYQCQPNGELELLDTALGPFENALRALYRNHDLSGDQVEVVRDWEMNAHGSRIAVTVYAAVSRQLSLEASFDDNGEVQHVPLRRPTNWGCRFELATGLIDLICDRGGKVVRDQSADAFVEHVLGQRDPPIAVGAPPFALERMMPQENLPAIEGVRELIAKEITVEHPSFQNDRYVVQSEKDAWKSLELLTQAPSGDLGPCRLVALKLVALFDEGTGPTRRAEKSITFDVFENGNTSLKLDGKRHRLLHDALVPYLSDPDAGHDLAA